MRFYDPTTGRFTQRDPARDGINSYAYAHSDPAGDIDADGRVTICIPIGRCRPTSKDGPSHWVQTYWNVIPFPSPPTGSATYFGTAMSDQWWKGKRRWGCMSITSEELCPYGPWILISKTWSEDRPCATVTRNYVPVWGSWWDVLLGREGTPVGMP